MKTTKVEISETHITRSRLLQTEATCIDCGNPFKVSVEEYSRYKEKNIPLPTRCKACRRYKLIEIKLKKITKLLFLLFTKAGGKYEQKLQKKPGKRNITPKETRE